ncbi:MAG: hypothetical protein L0Y71_18815 [Gemmataceae bacterium]|nr:hypothetical protein [Gemmataceae bacterium]
MDRDMKTCQKAAARCLEKFGQVVERLVKQADNEMAKAIAKTIAKARDAIGKQFNEALAELRKVLEAIQTPTWLDEREFVELHAWLEQFVDYKLDPLRKYMSIDSKTEIAGKSRKMVVTARWKWKQHT